LRGVVTVVPVTIALEAVPEELKPKYISYSKHAVHTINSRSAMKMFFGENFQSWMMKID
jgi:versiconal hemiacetal acetate esterase